MATKANRAATGKKERSMLLRQREFRQIHNQVNQEQEQEPEFQLVFPHIEVPKQLGHKRDFRRLEKRTRVQNSKKRR